MTEQMQSEVPWSSYVLAGKQETSAFANITDSIT